MFCAAKLQRKNETTKQMWHKFRFAIQTIKKDYLQAGILLIFLNKDELGK